MPTRRYTVLIADCSSGVARRVNVSARGVAVVLVGTLTLPVLIGLGAKWSARTEIARLQANNSALAVERSEERRVGKECRL